MLLQQVLKRFPYLSFDIEEFDIEGDFGNDDETSDLDEGCGDSELIAYNDRDMVIEEDGLSLKAVVTVPNATRGIVIFAHGSGSDRFSPRNQFIAKRFNAAGFATLAADLLTNEEAHDRMNVFDIDLLASRLTMVARWAGTNARLRGLPLALVGSNTGAAAALKAAAQLGDRVQAVISRGGRPDLASDILEDVLAPTLLIVGSEDTPILTMNEWVLPRMQAIHEMAVIKGSDHLFEEEGALDQVADLSLGWLERFLKTPKSWKSSFSRVQQAYII